MNNFWLKKRERREWGNFIEKCNKIAAGKYKVNDNTLDKIEEFYVQCIKQMNWKVKNV